MKRELARQLDADPTIGTDAIAVVDTAEPAPQPVDAGGELNAFFFWFSSSKQRLWLNGREYCDGGASYGCAERTAKEISRRPIESADRGAALAYLRANGHAKVADELEGDRFEPVEVQPRKGDTVEHPGSGMTMDVHSVDGDTLYGPADENGAYDMVMRWRGNGWRIKRRTGGYKPADPV